MSTYAVTCETLGAVHEALAMEQHDEARAILKLEMNDLSDAEIEDLLRMIILSPIKPRATKSI